MNHLPDFNKHYLTCQQCFKLFLNKNNRHRKYCYPCSRLREKERLKKWHTKNRKRRKQ